MRVRTEWTGWRDGIVGPEWYFGLTIWWVALHLGPASIRLGKGL